MFGTSAGDFFGTLSASEGEKFHDYVTNSRLE
jgi:hypothetical protein